MTERSNTADADRPVNTPRHNRGERMKALWNVGALLKMAWQSAPPLACAAIVCRLLRAGLPVTSFYVAKLIMDSLVRAVRSGEMDANEIILLVLLEAGLMVASDLLGRAAALLESLLGDRFSNRLSMQMIRHAMSLDVASFEDASFYDRLERVRQQTMQRVMIMAQAVAIAQDLVTVVILIAAIAVYSPILVALLVVTVVPSFLGETHFTLLSYSFLHHWTPQRRELEYFRWLGVAHESAREIKVFGLGEYFIDRYRRLADLFYEQNRALSLRRAGLAALLGLLATAGYYAGYALVIYRTLHGTLSVGDLIFLGSGLARCRRLMEGILTTISGISEQALHLDDLFAFFRSQPSIRSKPGALSVPRPIRLGIELRHVSFRYPGTEHYAIHDVSLTLHPGERLALVGENGAGKTTIVKLIARLYDPTEGQILLDGVDLREYALEDWWREIGIIFQNYMRYQMLLYENIGVGRVERIQDRERIERAARLSSASDIAARLERGFDQMIGRRFAGGVDLSGGEWQKVALARAYMRDAQLLILDEPTAALDARSERGVFERFATLTSGKMAVLISHRFSTTRMADKIVVIDNGTVLEGGTHEELLMLRGRYAELFELQASSYR